MYRSERAITQTHLLDAQFESKRTSKSMTRREPTGKDFVLRDLRGNVSKTRNHSTHNHEFIAASFGGASDEYGADSIDEVAVNNTTSTAETVGENARKKDKS